jgi:O-antigen/teichoic acid export membrane protein
MNHQLMTSEEFSLKKYMKFNYIGLLFFKAINCGLVFVTSVFFARMLGVKDYGIYAYVVVWVTMLSLFCQMGFGSLITRETSVYFSQKNWAHLKGLLFRGNQLVFLLSLLCVIVGELILFYLKSSHGKVPILVGQIGLMILPFMSLSALRAAALLGFRRVVLSQWPEQIITPIVLIGLFYFCYQVFKNSSWPVVAISCQLISVFIGFFLGGVFLNILLPKEIKKSSVKYLTKPWVLSGVTFLFLNGIVLLNNNVDIVLIGLLKSASDVAVYKVVTTICSILYIFISVFSTVSLPIFSKFYAQGDLEKSRRLIVVGSRIVTGLTLPVFVVIFFFGDFLLRFFYGSEYGDHGFLALKILVFGQLINAIFSPLGSFLVAMGQERVILKIFSLVLLFNIAIVLLLLPRFGINGAALGSTLGFILWNVVLQTLAYKKAKAKILF